MKPNVYRVEEPTMRYRRSTATGATWFFTVPSRHSANKIC
jgi:hypothetical protein